MQYADQQSLVGKTLGQFGGAAAMPTASRTLAARLESAANTISQQCARIEDALARVNGAPRSDPMGKAEKEAIRATAPLAQTVEAVEMYAKRLCDLASNLDQVA